MIEHKGMGQQVSTTSAAVQVIHTGIDAQSEKTSFHLVPNPASGMVRVERADASPAWLTLLDVQGRVVMGIPINGASAAVDVSGLKRGFYLVQITSVDKAEVMRLVLE